MPLAQPAEKTFWDHLEEARWALLRGLIYIGVGTAVAWGARNWLFALVRYPAERGAQLAGIPDFAFRIFEPAGGVVLMMQVALVAGVVATSPLWLVEVVRFITPGLVPRERRVALGLLPAAVVLFVGGAAFCYWITPTVFAFLLRFNQGLGAASEFTLVSYLYFFLRLVVIFGLVFELPLVIMFLVHFGILSTATLKRGWRLAIVIIMVVAAVATPTPDPFTMCLMAAPMALLYFLSILLGRLVERTTPGEEADYSSDDPYGLHAGDHPGLGPPASPPPTGH